MEKTLQLSTIVHTSYMCLDWAILFATATVQCLQIAFYGSLGAYFLLREYIIHTKSLCWILHLRTEYGKNPQNW